MAKWRPPPDILSIIEPWRGFCEPTLVHFRGNG